MASKVSELPRRRRSAEQHPEVPRRQGRLTQLFGDNPARTPARKLPERSAPATGPYVDLVRAVAD
jgi:hypothetical protein